MGRYIGVDLHKNMVCFLEGESGEKVFEKYKLEDVEMFRQTLTPDDEVGVETTTNTRFFVSKIRDRVKAVRVINPLQFKVISQSAKKTDRNDSELIAIFLSKGMLPEVRMKDENYSELESLAGTRDKLVKLKTSLKNKIHNILGAQGIITKREFMSSDKGLNKVLSYSVSNVARLELEVIVDQIKSLNEG
ncbi:transposase, partial [Candidatus Bathyarchaeota archaeon]|nr:IS110 family transposase [Candidatus Bathyarchaeota archaeon]NIU81496.1 transposase [Candidatus Bathyarchaeota archaeon]NIV68137.1 transposase [Candidatus Bathyarchaeota archaeon]